MKDDLNNIIQVQEEFENSTEAKKLEAWWKSGAGRRTLKEYFEGLQK